MKTLTKIIMVVSLSLIGCKEKEAEVKMVDSYYSGKIPLSEAIEIKGQYVHRAHEEKYYKKLRKDTLAEIKRYEEEKSKNNEKN